MYNLPIDIQRRIWEFDESYDNFDMEVIILSTTGLVYKMDRVRCQW